MSDRTLLLILGNGFTIDLLQHLGSSEEIDVRNLFRFGSHVPWPVDGEPGFLSFKHCPNLWNLGARPGNSEAEAIGLIEEVMTCVNVLALSSRTDHPIGAGRPNCLHASAYRELAAYLRHLFIHYNNQADEDTDFSSWSWCQFLRHISTSDRYSRVWVITYNYDIWLERMLRDNGVPFTVEMLDVEPASARMRILKPHGSISFTHKEHIDIDAFSLSSGGGLLDGTVADLTVRYDELARNYVLTAMIPPAGDSTRLNHTWAGQIRARARDLAKSLRKDDQVVVCGLSYWHVDRAELDELFVHLDPGVDVKVVNPRPPESLDAVLRSLFPNYIAYPSADILEELMP